MAEAAVSLAVEKLDNLLTQKAVYLRSLQGPVKTLKDELKTMQPFLKDAIEKQDSDERIRNWISQLREVAQDAEDALETFIYYVDTPWSRRLLGKVASFPGFVLYFNWFRKQVGSIQKRIEQTTENAKRYKLQHREEVTASPTRSQQLELAPWWNDKNVVGLEEDVEKLLKDAISEENRGLSIAAIVGPAGIGKSTLARKLYDHLKITEQFDRRAWVCVSSEFRQRELIKELILQLLDLTEDKQKVLANIVQMDEPRLREMLYQQLQGKRYFIVLDDVWEAAHWESLATALPNEDKGSRLLVISRDRHIKKHDTNVHEMKILDPNKCWELFLKKAIVDDDTEGNRLQELENTGREVVRRCLGLPLLITMVGSLLSKQSRGWAEVLKELKSNMERGRELKSCFLCLSFFKEDATIRAEKLVQIWIAEGLVAQGTEKTMEEVATSYLEELIDRNMIQVKDMSKDGRVKDCHIHDLVRDLAIRKATEEISFEILREEENAQSLDKPRHRTMYSSQGRPIESATDQNKHLRTLFVHRASGSIEANPPYYWKSFELLRVLDFEDYGLEKLPDAVGGLIGLRYLGLRNNKLRRLPRSLDRLKRLEVLDIALNFVVDFPTVIWKLDSLRHLYISAITCSGHVKIDMKNLRTLLYIPGAYWKPEEMTSLQKLGIQLDENSDVSELSESLAKVKNLVYLKIRGTYIRSTASVDGLHVLHNLTKLKLRCWLTRLPKASGLPPNLSCLSLVQTYLDEDPMPTLEKLQKLRYLKLHQAYTGHELVISKDGFPKLKVLSVHRLLELKDLKVENGALQELQHLEIDFCPHVECLPEAVSFMSQLQELKMVTTTEIASKLRSVIDSYQNSSLKSVNLTGY